MAWDGTTQERYRRDTERYESDLTDCEWSVAGPGVALRSGAGVLNNDIYIITILP